MEDQRFVMKERPAGFIIAGILVFMLLVISGCEKNKAPVCSIVSPANSSTYDYGQDVAISIKANDPEGDLRKIELYVDNNKLTETSEATLSYTLDTEDMPVGRHVIKAVATDDEGNAGEDNISFTINPLVLSPPQGMTIYAHVEEIQLYWYAYGAKSYNIFWTDDGSDPTTSSNKIPVQEDSYTHTNLNPSKTYSYRVQAVNGPFTSDLSEMVSASPELSPLPSPINVNATAGSSSIMVSWDAVNVQGVTYSIKRKESTGYFSEIVSELSGTDYSDYNIDLGKGYSYKVFAHDAATSRTSEGSEPAYAVTQKIIYETERNNENITSSLQFDTHYYDAEDVTYDLDSYRIKGGYSAYSIYSAGSYKNYEADCFNLNLKNGDMVEFELITGNMADLWSMSVSLHVYTKSSSGNYSDGKIYSFKSPTDTYTFNYTGSNTLVGVYLDISMWEDLINSGPYNYEIEITIKRNN